MRLFGVGKWDVGSAGTVLRGDAKDGADCAGCGHYAGGGLHDGMWRGMARRKVWWR